MSTRFPGRRLSIIRLIGVFAVAACLVFAGFQGWNQIADSASVSAKPWMAGYVDVTATPSLAFENPVSAAGDNVVLSFIVADPTDACTPTWGTFYTMAAAESDLDLDRRVARRTQQGGEVIVSFGGAINQELAVACTDPAALEAAYASVIERYRPSTIDLDLEGANLTDVDAGARRGVALAALQKAAAASAAPLAIWLTLPTTPTGLTEDGTNAVTQLLTAGVNLSGVNLMTMDFGSSRAAGQSMADAATQALQSAHGQLSTLYRRAGQPLGSKALWNKLGATAMIGQNDVPGEIFTLADAVALNGFALANGVGRMSMWSLNRDASCGANYPDVKQVSDSCSGVEQGSVLFADVLGASFTGSPAASAGDSSTAQPTAVATDTAAATDDPATSPYRIWSVTIAYPKGTRVVWHHNVYSAKYWTQGDLPDNPVLQASETPWRLIGPVLAGETPVPTLTLPAGSFPEWSGTTIYTKGQRVLFETGAFEAKWWTQGDSPDAAAENPDASPWVALTDAQLRVLLGLPAIPADTDSTG